MIICCEGKVRGYFHPVRAAGETDYRSWVWSGQVRKENPALLVLLSANSVLTGSLWRTQGVCFTFQGISLIIDLVQYTKICNQNIPVTGPL
jgi:hypothetical protein